ncbi:latexin isoform X2 [Alosa sapidissima]|uniref:latexin isoform X2 n=2 Tax=Alosa sapidissima TaxID=34773 RepID=UPI001C094AE7|nr:latexin isoform X2 [Alosa sapidissima]XP_041920443.1 latexin isoform X2 [Alosa sapidissima]
MGRPGWTLWVVVVLIGDSLAGPYRPDAEPGPLETNNIEELEVPPELDGAMSDAELVPHHYPAQRAAKVAVHYLNTRHASPYSCIELNRVHKASLEDLGQAGKKYRLQISLKECVSNTDLGQCLAEVLFPGEQEQRAPQVQCSCEGLKKLNNRAEEDALFQRLNTSNSPLSGSNIPDSYGNIAPEMKPMWHLGAAAASFVMLKESNESTLYNMAQVANFTQLETENDQLRFKYHILLHDMISQEILHWKLLVAWSPAGGVSVPQADWEPKCHHCELPLAKSTPEATKPSSAS